MHSILDIQPKRATKTEKGFLKGQIMAAKSFYQPSRETKDRIQELLHKFERDRELHTRPYREFNNKSLIQIQDECQRLFLNYRADKSDDPDEQWRSNAIRPIVRNRAVSVAAHVTATMPMPKIIAQNDQQQEDKEAAVVLGDLIEWANEQSQYVQTLLYAIIGAIVNPASVIHTEFARVWRTERTSPDDAGIKVEDEIMSGFRDTLVPLDELFVANIYEPDFQKQPHIFWRRAVPFETLVQKYADNEIFMQYVRPGIHAYFDSATGSFFDVYDESQQDRMAEELIYYDRLQDLQLTTVNGVLIDHHNQPMRRLDRLYPFVKGGYEPIERFFYYFSLVRKMKDDAEIINMLYQMVIDGTFLKIMPASAIYGDEIVNSAVIAPGAINTFKEETKMDVLDTRSDLNAGFATLNRLEDSISESSQDILQSGQRGRGNVTAFQISREEHNARIMLGMFVKMIAFMVRDFGRLRIGDIMQHMTVADVMEISGEEAPLKYRTFFISNKTDGKKQTSHKIMFNAERDYTAEEIMMLEGGADEAKLDDLSEEERGAYFSRGFDSDMRLYMIHPQKLRKMKYRAYVRPEMVTPPSDVLQRALNLELWDRASQAPEANREALFRDLLLGSYDATKDNTDKYVRADQGLPVPNAGGRTPNVMQKLLGAPPNVSV